MARDLTAPYCSVCHTGYRGLYVVHLTTDKHRASAAPKLAPRTNKRREAYDRARAVGDHDRRLDASPVSVRRYRRRPPFYAAAGAPSSYRTVRVKPYRRACPFIVGGRLHVPHPGPCADSDAYYT